MFTPDVLFQFANTFVLIGWIFLLFLPTWKFSVSIARFFVVVPLSMLYAFLVVQSFGNFDPNMFSTLAGVKSLFGQDLGVLVGWIHYLAFDLFVGTYIVKKAQSMQMPRFLYTICLPFTFMFGPLGLLLFYVFWWFISMKKVNASN
ncbi:MAG: ABA4-like family protein [Flavobacterium sp.]